MMNVPFSSEELEIIGEIPTFPGYPPLYKFNTPIGSKENLKMVLNGEKPLWMPIHADIQAFRPRIIQDNIACGIVIDAEPPLEVSDFGGIGWFGTEWVYAPEIGGATTNPGNPQLDDANDWEKILEFPDIDSYDWGTSARLNKDFFDQDRLHEACILCGLYERLISLMDVANASVALIDDDQKTAVHAFFNRLCLLYDQLIEKFQKYFNPDVIHMHDDWGHQNSTFFSVETHEEMILPYLKRIVDSCHSRGMLFHQHSCGKIESLLPNMIEAGIDIWEGQDLNDKETLIDKYGDKILMSAEVPVLPKHASNEEQIRSVQEFLEKYKNKRMFAFVRTADAQKHLYMLSRLEYGKER